MAGAKEVDQSYQDKPETINNDLVAMKEIEMEEEKPGEDKEEVDEEEAEAEGEAEEDVEEEDDEEEDGDEEDEETEDSEDEDDEEEKKLQSSLVDIPSDRRKELHMEGSHEKSSHDNPNFPADAVESGRDLQADNAQSDEDDGDTDDDVPVASLKSGLVSTQMSPVNDKKVSIRPEIDEDNGTKLDVCDALNHQSVDDETMFRTDAGASLTAQSPASKADHVKEDGLKDESKIEEGLTGVESRNASNLFMFDTDTSGGGDSGTEKEQAAFIMELHKFYKERGVDFKPPKFYQEPLNLLKLWRAVLKLGGYDKVTACKYWRQVGESFRPPKTCTTVSWTFRIFYEKALLDYERYRTSADGSGLHASLSVPMGVENQPLVGCLDLGQTPLNEAPGPGRARRDAAARAMQGWHSQRILDNGEVSDPIIKDKNSVSLSKKEKPLKSLGGSLKRKKPSSSDDAVKSTQMKSPKIHSDATVIDIGSPADWVKINVRATRDCYEVYALVPGLLREEVRVQSDPAGRLVISGEPENPDNPWNVTPFKKVVSLPSRIDPHQTSAVVTLHGQLFVRVPFEQFD